MKKRIADIEMAEEDEVPSVSELTEAATALYRREYVAIKNTQFASTSDRLRALQDAKDALDNANKLLDAEEEDEKNSSPLPPEGKRASEEVWKYVRASLWGALNGIRNMKLRSDYIKKIMTQSLNKQKILDLTPSQLEVLAEDAVYSRNAILEATRAKLAKSSQSFSQWLKREGMTYDELVNKYTEKSFPGQSFDSLEDIQKGKVYGEIIQASGRSNSLVNRIAKVQGAIGVATLILTLGVVVWDVVTSNDPVLTATKDVWVQLGSLGAGFVGDTVASAAISAGLVAADVAETTAAAVAFIGGIASGFVLAVLAAPLFADVFELMANALSLHIPKELKTTMITVITIPLHSALKEELTTPMTTSMK